MKRTRLVISTILLIILIASKNVLALLNQPEIWDSNFFITLKNALIIACISWISIEVVGILKTRLLKKYDITNEDNLKSRKLITQINLLEKVIVFIIIITSVGLILFSIESIKEIGIGIFASAGVVGIIIGLSAQKIMGALLAGIQIAITQPFRVDDAVVVENEWGWIEEINLTYVVVRIWDKRRLVLPSTYFLEKPFQNWTRTTADIIGTVFIYTDYTVPIEPLREELTRLLNDCDLWDKNVNVLQVTDSTPKAMEIRILVSAKNSPTAWDLRVFIREKMIEFIQKNYPESLPRTRINLENKNINND
ncbi:mechanosensitive ion channel family protein [Plebeiibacterium sediminum]|uniref:Mechanosensitive ion channel family protein n=1 Tax=Plebeiibacterium sediminum TaxID=2992112 RepID=A0AAE3SFM4_9BACT|nr:mechanosensitive ion channel domain-containing protein [Plebeiobacterium sediminum]MCW3787411.1 mechanosensitive ion channel family protein [Plebeiobacterium sediminum]